MISYAITVCNEHKEIDKLLSFLFKHTRPNDDVVVQMDVNSTDEVTTVCEGYEMHLANDYRYHKYALDKDFASYKNNLNKKCRGDWIFQIDADELPNEYLIKALPFILEANPETEAYWVPRVNTVAGITDEHIAKWGWRLSGPDNWVNFPDWQMRVYRKSDHIFWVKPVHEQLKGYTKFANLPAEEKFCLYHPKDIGRQEKQNAFYETI